MHNIGIFQKLKIVPVPVEGYGKFFNGDAYIIYACTEYGKPGGMNMKVKDRCTVGYKWFKIN